MLGAVVLAAAGAAVLALEAQDARLLRLGLVAALWAALLGAFAAARMRREISSGASRADELRTIYQLELEREVAARREHTLTVERELREQIQQVEQREIVALRAELAAMRANLEKLMGGDLLVERVALRAESARLLPMRGPLGEQFRVDRSPVGSALPTSEGAGHGRSETALTPGEDPEPRFGHGPRYRHELDTHARPLVEPASSGDRPWKPAVSSTPVWESAPTRWGDGISHAQGNGRHGAPSQESSGSSSSNGSHHNGSHHNGSHHNGSHHNGSHHNGGGARREAQEAPVVGPQRSVNDLLAAHGVDSAPRRRHSREAD
jgi:hypothetical protein